MIISSIVATDRNNVIGIKNRMPWHLPADLQYFKKITTGHCIIMGRKNFDSIGKPLPNRTNIVLSRDKKFYHSGCIICNSIEKALEIAYDMGEKEVFIAGGAQIYNQTIDYWDRIYITEIDAEYKGDVFFPKIDLEYWKLKSEKAVPISDKNIHKLNFKVYERKNKR